MLEKTTIGQHKVRVTFRLPKGLWADQIVLVGTFHPEWMQGYLLERTRNDEDWHTSLDLPSGQAYRFHYLLDGQEWLNDDHPDTYGPNALGRLESILYT